MDDRRISFVVQGPIQRDGAGSTLLACEAIRRWFPRAEIVLSTWKGQDASGVSHDQLVLSDDPGSLPTFQHNTNRLIASSLAGINRASRELVMKTRSDLIFRNDGVLGHWERWNEFAPEMRLMRCRVLMPNVFARRPSYLSPMPFHPSDWCFFGLKDDLLTLFDVPLLTPTEAVHIPPRADLVRLFWGPNLAPRYTPEQWIWLSALRRKHPDVDIQHAWDLTPETLRATELSFANNFVILDAAEQFGVESPKYPDADRAFRDFTLYHHDEWAELYDFYVKRRGKVSHAAPVDVLGRLEDVGTWSLGDPRIGALRRAGLRWEAQLVECVIASKNLLRDATTGSNARRMFDQYVGMIAAAELVARRTNLPSFPERELGLPVTVEQKVARALVPMSRPLHLLIAVPKPDLASLGARKAGYQEAQFAHLAGLAQVVWGDDERYSTSETLADLESKLPRPLDAIVVSGERALLTDAKLQRFVRKSPRLVVYVTYDFWWHPLRVAACLRGAARCFMVLRHRSAERIFDHLLPAVPKVVQRPGVEPRVFRPVTGPKTHDIVLAGRETPDYPLRRRLHRLVRENAAAFGWRVNDLTTSEALSDLPGTQLEYAAALGAAKVSVTASRGGGGEGAKLVLQYLDLSPVRDQSGDPFHGVQPPELDTLALDTSAITPRYLEALAAGCLLIADVPAGDSQDWYRDKMIVVDDGISDTALLALVDDWVRHDAERGAFCDIGLRRVKGELAETKGIELLHAIADRL